MAEGMTQEESGYTVYIVINEDSDEAKNNATGIDKQMSTDTIKVVYAANDVKCGSNEVSECIDLMDKSKWIVVLFNDKPENALFEYQIANALSMAVYKRCANIVFVLPANELERQIFATFKTVRQERHWITAVKHIVSKQPQALNLKEFKVNAPKEWLFHMFLATGGKHFTSPGRLRKSHGQLSRQSSSDDFQQMYVNEVYNDNMPLNYQRQLPVEHPQQDVSSHDIHESAVTPILGSTLKADRSLNCTHLLTILYLLLLSAAGFYIYTLVYKQIWIQYSTGYTLFLITLLVIVQIGYHYPGPKRLCVCYTMVLLADILLYGIFYVLIFYVKFDIIMCSLILMGILIVLMTLVRVIQLYSLCQSDGEYQSI